MSPADTLLTALIGFYDGLGRGGDAGALALLDRVLIALRRCGEPAIGHSRAVPPARLLAPALDRVAPPLAPLAASIGAAAPLFRWRQNPNYTDANMGAAFMAGYGYVEFAGLKDALFHAAAIRVGLLVLGPGLHYPPHAHPAEEAYHPLTEGAQWRRGNEPLRPVEAGDAIHHPPMTVHETRVGAATLLALYCWAGDTGTEARLVG
jgi:quercetin dioxygenase-like cupin family protein